MRKQVLLVAVFTLASFLEGSTQQINIAKDKQASGFPVIDRNPFQLIVDGDPNTLWNVPQAVADRYVEIDLGAEYQIDRVLLKNYKGFEAVKVSVSAEGRSSVVYEGNMPAKHIITFQPINARIVRLEIPVDPATYSDKARITIGELEVFAFEPQPVLVNQTGYNLLATKRFTAPRANDGTSFSIKDMAGRIVHRGTIHGNVGDFTEFMPNQSGPYVVEVLGHEHGRSFPFNIEPYMMERASYFPAMAFMADARCWFGCADDYTPTAAGPGCPFLGVAWRDSHQFSFEIPVLLSWYFANPEAFTQERMPDIGIYSGLREKLPDNTPEIIKMVYWAVDIYLRGEVNHTLLKGQLAWFLYAYPHLNEYIPKNVYDEAVEYLFEIWGNPERDRWNWHDIEHSADLFQTYTIIGPGKGQFPPGFSVVPNLMMYEVAIREGRNDAERYWNAAYKQTEWLIKNLDWNDPATTKGQRMNEYITLDAFHYFLVHYADRAPSGLAEKMRNWADVALSRSENLWDYRMYSDSKWTIPDILEPTDEKFNPEGSFNEVGNIAGFPAPALAAAWMAERYGWGDEKASRLRAIATSHTDHVFGRNPAGRHFSYDAVRDFEGADLGWFREYEGGAGLLQHVRGVLDGSAKEAVFPYDPYGGDPGHTEGWVTFNTAWIMGLAYQAADATRVEVYNDTWTNTITHTKTNSQVNVRLYAPLNFNPDARETARVIISNANGESAELVLTENEENGLYFDGVLDLERLPFAVKQKQAVTISYGLEHFRQSTEIKIN